MKDVINFQAFDTPVTKQQIHDTQNTKPGVMSKRAWLVVVIFLAIFFGVLRAWALEASAADWLITFLANFSVAAAVGLFIWWIGVVLSDKATERRIRLGHFASDNNLTYISETAKPAYPGIIFSSGSPRQLYDRFRAEGFEIGNYRYTVQHGKSSTTYKYGYICINLERHVAHMLLDAKSNNTKIFGLNISNLPVTINKDQTLALEGDFNDHFTLYAPKEYERDALYIFTPDLMALLIDQVAQFDVEVIDNQLFVYGKEFNFTERKVWQRIADIITKVGQKTITQTDYYADERVGDRSQDSIAEPGKRLRKGLSWYVIIFAVLWALSYVLQIILAHR